MDKIEFCEDPMFSKYGLKMIFTHYNRTVCNGEQLVDNTNDLKALMKSRLMDAYKEESAIFPSNSTLNRLADMVKRLRAIQQS